MYILGLTGSIGMGKSTAAQMFRRQGVPVYDADAAVHQAFAPGGAAVAPVLAEFSDVGAGGGIDRAALRREVVGDSAALRRLEAIVHPIVYAAQHRFLRRAAGARAPVVVLDIPLLFETGGDKRCDAVAVVSAPRFVQRQRVLRRPGMTVESYEKLLREQMADAEKRRRADFLLQTGLGKRFTYLQILHVLSVIRRRRGRAWPRRHDIKKIERELSLARNRA